jgi:hypothetical protein
VLTTVGGRRHAPSSPIQFRRHTITMKEEIAATTGFMVTKVFV